MSEPTKQLTSDQLAMRIFLITVGGALAFISTVAIFILR
jgi:hypothetical protein